MERLKNHRNTLTSVTIKIQSCQAVSFKSNLTLRRQVQSCQQGQKCRLPGAGGAYNRIDLSLLERAGNS